MADQQERLELFKSWFAGFFEGEGWVCLMKGSQSHKGRKIDRYMPVCGLINTDFTVLQSCKDLLDRDGICYHVALIDPRKKGYKKLWRINFSGYKRCIAFLEWILPYMRGDKVERTQKIFKFCKIREKEIKGFRGKPYSQEMINLYQELVLKSPTTIRQTLKSEDIV